MLDFRRITLFCLEKHFSKHKMTIFSKNLRGPWALWPPLATPMVDVHGGDDLYCRWMRDFAFVMRRSPLNYPHYCSVCSNVA